MSLRATVLFHLNLGYSSLEPEDRPRVVDRCYRPMLGLLDRVPGLVLAVEASGWTLAEAARIAPDWVEALAAAVRAGRVELVGSGEAQVVGPLVPEAVHRRNQELGRRAYEELLGARPTTALVAELAWSQGIVDGYLDAGYELLLAEWNNPRRRHPEWDDAWRYGTVRTRSPRGREARLLWVDSVAFQRLQRAVHGELEEDDYRAWVRAHGDPARERHLALYANDAEVFDHRPGRFRAEPRLAGEGGEWERLAALLRAVAADGARFATPRAVAADPAFAPAAEVTLTSIADPIPTKKQPKYNVTRWAVTGRDDLGLNARCHAEARRLAAAPDADDEAWRRLCRWWASDHRTHLSERRWRALAAELPPPAPPAPPAVGSPLREARVERDGRYLRVATDGVRLELDTRRGLAVRALELAAAGPGALAGTLPQGTFDDIAWSADFYTGHVVLDEPARQRVADLEPVEPEVDRASDRVTVAATVPTARGPLRERIVVLADRVRVELDLSDWGERPLGSLRAGFVTLLPEAWGPELRVTCAQGGAPERIPVDGPCDHGRAVSALVSASAGLGATDGRLALDDGTRRLELAWDPARAPALPMLLVNRVAGRRLVRVALSLSEVDETHRPGASLCDLVVEVSGGRCS